MRVIADLHVHGRFSYATSKNMNISEIARFASIKGLGLVASGDFTHPKWLEELKSELIFDEQTDSYKFLKSPYLPVRFLISTEVCTNFRIANKVKRVHHVILVPNLEIANQINEKLEKHGNLSSDGRPQLNVTAAEMVEEVMDISNNNLIFPAHIWTPWFGVLGSSTGFESIEDCYQDMTKHIHALETGLSSDPPMNWRISKLDRYTLLSNSDCHSYWPWRIGREANVLELKHAGYLELVDVIRSKDKLRFRYTIEVDPAYGKYHWTGHKDCGVVLSPKEALKISNICPICKKKIKSGVEQRVEELADRPRGFDPANKIEFVRLLPLSDIIQKVIASGLVSSKKVWAIYNRLIEKFGNEYSILLDVLKSDLLKVIPENLAEAIVNVRAGQVTIIPGYDGVYGQLVKFESTPDISGLIKTLKQPKSKQRTALITK